MDKPVESWRVADARAARRNEALLFASEDDKCNNCGCWTAAAIHRLDVDGPGCACDEETLAALGEDADYPDLWGDDGTTRVVPFTYELLDRFGVPHPVDLADEQESGALRAEQLIWRWARTAKEKAFLEGLAAGLTQGEAARASGLLHPENLLRRIRAQGDALAA